MQSPSSSYQESEEEVDQEDYYSDDDRVSLRSNKRTKTKSNNDGRDRISALPDPLLHHILSFMDMKEVMGTNSLSRRWRYLWKYIPILSFSHILWYVKHKMRSGDSEKRMFMDFVKQVLLLRDISSTIKILSFHCSRYCKTDQVDDWMRVAVTRHVEEVILNYDPGMYTVLPGFIFNSAISVFKLSSFPHALQVPNSICLAPKLKTLELESVRLPEGNSICEVVFSCPMLENLSIIYCDHSHIYMLNISALQLKNLKIQNTVECGNSSCFISISAPNLTSLRLKGSLYANYYLENLSSLVDAKIECLLYERVYPQLLIKILRGLQNATSLELSGQSLSTIHLDIVISIGGVASLVYPLLAFKTT
ncbi:hypothetical protein IFM89_021882 [Coptis chinensis]|uniref:F-box domain-containing protein n=1 Tax=Coptis chinensis TaxID=261450 RepID=A0A835HGC7_9MAGN|nr:hypothetical protein IFM89_021882 [Coptis chinensis]